MKTLAQPPPLFSEWELDPELCGIVFDTGYCRFRTASGLHGLAQVNGTTLEILAIGSDREGQGHVRRFFAQAKELYDEIQVLEIWNDVLSAALTRYGFHLDPNDPGNMVWRK